MKISTQVKLASLNASGWLIVGYIIGGVHVKYEHNWIGGLISFVMLFLIVFGMDMFQDYLTKKYHDK